MRIAAVLLAALVGAAPAWAENRAVIIGNADYRSAPDLAGSDTMALAKALREAGFTTQQGLDLEARPLRRLLESLARADADPGARIVALNGRFLHDAEETWFMGTDADTPGPAAAGGQGVPLSLVMRLMAGGDPGAVLILGTDAQQMPHRPGLENGIGALRPPAGVSVVTGPPEAGARALARLLDGATLAQASAGRALSLLPEAAGDLRPVPPRKAADALADDRDAWAEAAVADTALAYRDYLARFPQGIYAADARDRLAQIGRAPGVRHADRAAWSLAAATDTAAAYATYLKQFPAGPHAGAARKRLAELRPVPPARPASQPASAVAAEQALSLGPAGRAAVQRHLSRLGLQPGAADGVFGPRTRLAISGWQRANGLAVTGHLTGPQVRMIAEQAEGRATEAAAQDRAFWRQSGASGDAGGLRAYLDRYPQGIHAEAARRQLAGAGTGQDAPMATRRHGAGPAARARPRPMRPIWNASPRASMRRPRGNALPPCAPASRRRGVKRRGLTSPRDPPPDRGAAARRRHAAGSGRGRVHRGNPRGAAPLPGGAQPARHRLCDPADDLGPAGGCPALVADNGKHRAFVMPAGAASRRRCPATPARRAGGADFLRGVRAACTDGRPGPGHAPCRLAPTGGVNACRQPATRRHLSAVCAPPPAAPPRRSCRTAAVAQGSRPDPCRVDGGSALSRFPSSSLWKYPRGVGAVSPHLLRTRAEMRKRPRHRACGRSGIQPTGRSQPWRALKRGLVLLMM